MIIIRGVNYDKNFDGRISRIDFAGDKKKISEFKKVFKSLPAEEQRILLTRIDRNMFNQLGIKHKINGLYNTNNIEYEAITAKWGNKARTIWELSKAKGLPPVLMASILDADKFYGKGLDDNNYHTQLEQRFSLYGNVLKSGHNDYNYIYSIAEYGIRNGIVKNSLSYLKSMRLRGRNFTNITIRDDEFSGYRLDKLSEYQRKYGIISQAFITPNSYSDQYVRKVLQYHKNYNLKASYHQYFPKWIQDRIRSKLLNKVSCWINPLNFPSFWDFTPKKEVVLQGDYFELYQKFVYLGLATKINQEDFTSVNLALILKNSGYLKRSIFDKDKQGDNCFKKYIQTGDITAILDGAAVKEINRILDKEIGELEKHKSLMANIAYINKLQFRTTYYKKFTEILKSAKETLGVDARDLIKVYYKDKEIKDFKINLNHANKTLYYFKCRLLYKYGYRFKSVEDVDSYRVKILPKFQKFMMKKYRIELNNYSYSDQYDYIKEFVDKINQSIAKINKDIQVYNDKIDQQKLKSKNRIAQKKLDDNKKRLLQPLDIRKLLEKKSLTGDYEIDHLLMASTLFINKYSTAGLPIYYWVGSSYGWRDDPVALKMKKEGKNVDVKREFHYGYDIPVRKDSKIESVSSGDVVAVGSGSGWGKYMMIQPNENERFIYAHLNNILYKKGDFVKKGAFVALSGKTGRATGYHLHIEYQVRFKRLNGSYYWKAMPMSKMKLSIYDDFAQFYNKKYRD